MGQLRPGTATSVTLEGISTTFSEGYWDDAVVRMALADGRQWYEWQCDILGESIADALKMLVRRRYGLPGEASDRDKEQLVGLLEEGRS